MFWPVPGAYERKKFEVASTIAKGDSRRKVRSVLGEPLVNAPHHGLEVYHRSGRDFGVIWIIAPWVPIPGFGEKEIAAALIHYDKNDLVSEIAAGKVERNLYSYNQYWISVND